jgi:PAS domain S-box-containing protein
MATGEPVVFEDVRDGRWMISNIYPIKNPDGNVDQLAFFSRDVTESKKSEQALIESEEKYHRLFDTASLGIFQSTPEGQAISVNPAFVRMFGYDSIEDALTSLSDVSTQLFVDPNRRSEIIALMQKNPELKTFENEYRRKDGTSFLGQLTSFPIRDPNDKIIRIEGIIEDITERRRAEERIRKKGAQLQLMNAEKDKFFSIIAHDLRSPFNALLGLTELMAEDLQDMTFEETQKMVFALRNTANKLVHLVDNLLEWSRAQRGQTNPVVKPLRLTDEVTVCVDQVQPTADKKRIMIQTDINENVIVEADPQMFGSLLRNLVFNAVKFTPKGGEILISAEVDPSDLVEVTVRDNGIGMSQDVVDKLFCVNGDIRRNGTEGESGSGLGLILCKEYVEKHGGKIWLESIPGKGSTFHFTIPGH